MAWSNTWGESINDYEIQHLLGKGGFASVYKARNKRSNEYVAIKMIDKNLIRGQAMADRVRQEVEIHSRLKHPSVLELYTFFQDANYVYLVLELAHNGELQRYMKQTMKRVMTETEAASILQQVVAGLLYLHSHNIMHRDISLSNLLLSKDMHIKIADFGLATQLKQPNERHVTMCGTPNYISPEVVSRASHGLSADVWGLGCMFYTLLVGQPPFDTDAVQTTLNKVISSDYHTPSHVSYEARDLIDRLLKKDPDERIKLQDVLLHPFMQRFNFQSCRTDMQNMPKDISGVPGNRTVSSCDSGILTFASSTTSEAYRQKSNSRTNEFYPHDDITANVYLQQMSIQNQNKWSGASATSEDYENLMVDFRSLQSPNIVRANNEATPKRPNQLSFAATKLSVPPLNTMRLQPTRYKTKNAIMSIKKSGEVVIEFIKYRAKYNSERVTDICWISGDGTRIVVHQPDSGRGLPVADQPPELPLLPADCTFSYDTLPSKHWKKYVYAARFVGLVKSKTPKVTYFSPLAKCVLMESMEDFECCFYNGARITKCCNNLHVYDCNGRQLSTSKESDTTRPLIEHQEECLEHCRSISNVMETNLSVLPNNFPVVVGKRPSTVKLQQLSIKRESNTNIIYSSTPKYEARPQAEFSLDIGQKRSSEHLMGQSQTSVRRVDVPGVGFVTEFAHGLIQIQCNDSSIISVLPFAQGGGITYTHSNGISTHFALHDDLPSQVRDKVNQLPAIERLLKASDYSVAGKMYSSDESGFSSSTRATHHPANTIKFLR